MAKEKRFYHGGIPGLTKGDKILPPIITGKSTLLQYAAQIDPDHAQRPDRIYVTTDPKAAEIYAVVYPNGTLYKVQPDGELEDDPDCLEPGLSYQCSSATIKAVIKVGCCLKVG